MDKTLHTVNMCMSEQVQRGQGMVWYLCDTVPAYLPLGLLYNPQFYTVQVWDCELAVFPLPLATHSMHVCMCLTLSTEEVLHKCMVLLALLEKKCPIEKNLLSITL